MKRILLGVLPAMLLGSGCAVATRQDDPLDELRCSPYAKYTKPKESWQGQGKRKRPRNK